MSTVADIKINTYCGQLHVITYWCPIIVYVLPSLTLYRGGRNGGWGWAWTVSDSSLLKLARVEWVTPCRPTKAAWTT